MIHGFFSLLNKTEFMLGYSIRSKDILTVSCMLYPEAETGAVQFFRGGQQTHSKRLSIERNHRNSTQERKAGHQR